MKKALIVWGGWTGHQPREVGELFARVLRADGFEVELSDTLDAFTDLDKLMGLNLIVPIWTMGKITNEQATRCCGRCARAASASPAAMAGCAMPSASTPSGSS
jgi:type 1 glutamine amidotransferase